MRLSTSLGFALLCLGALTNVSRADESCRIAAADLARAPSGDPGDVLFSRSVAEGLARAAAADRARVAAGDSDGVGAELHGLLDWASGAGAMVASNVAELATRLRQLDCALHRGAYAQDRSIADRLYAAISDELAPLTGGSIAAPLAPPSLKWAPAPPSVVARAPIVVSMESRHRTAIGRIVSGAIMIVTAVGALVGAGYATQAAVALAQPCGPRDFLCFNEIAPAAAAGAGLLYSVTIGLTAGGAALIANGRREREPRISAAPTGLRLTF